MMPTLHDAERLQPVQCQSLEGLAVKIGMYEADIVREALDRFPIKQIRERAAFLDRAWGRGKARASGGVTFPRHGGSYPCPRAEKSTCLRGIF